jgi:hypothetical protein
MIRSQSESDYTIGESIFELIDELDEESLGRLTDEDTLAGGHPAVAQPDFAVWWRCSRTLDEVESRSEQLRARLCLDRHPQTATAFIGPKGRSSR